MVDNLCFVGASNRCTPVDFYVVIDVLIFVAIDQFSIIFGRDLSRSGESFCEVCRAREMARRPKFPVK